MVRLLHIPCLVSSLCVRDKKCGFFPLRAHGKAFNTEGTAYVRHTHFEIRLHQSRERWFI